MHAKTRTSLGLFTAWVLHDAEELLTLAPGSRAALSALPGWLPIPPQLRAHGVSQAHVNLSISLMGVAVGAAAIHGVCTRGQSVFYRGALLAFGLHGFGHIGQAIARRGYSPGVLTSAIVVIPHWQTARRVLHRHGMRSGDAKVIVVALAGVPVLVATQVVAGLMLGPRSVGTAAERPW